jgi:hypothetical protein
MTKILLSAQNTSRLLGVLTGLFALFVNAGSCNAAPTPNYPVPLSFFGMVLISKTNWPTVPVGALGKGTFVNWPYIQPSQGVYKWSNLDAWVRVAKQHNVSFHFAFEGVPQWAASDLSTCHPIYLNFTNCPPNIQYWDDYVTALVTRYKGQIQYYELWNEPDQSPTIAISDMVTLTNHAYNIIRSIDPSAKIISPSILNTSYADQYYAAGGTTSVDIIGMHAYSDPALGLDPEGLTPSRYLLEGVLSIISKYDLQDKPLWDTEGSFGDIKSKNPDQQAAFLARYILLHWTYGVTRFYWYAWDNDTTGPLMSPEKNPSAKASVAYRQVQEWMIGATMSPCAAQTTSIGTFWTCKFSRPNGYEALAIWMLRDSSAYYSPPSQYKQYRDLDGNIVKITDHNISIGIKPILLENMSAF